MARATRILLIANCLIFILEKLLGDSVIEAFALWPLGTHFQFWQLLTSGFLHASWMHLLANMFGLWMFGRDVELRLGTRNFLQLYFASLFTAAIAQLAVTAMLQQDVPTLGASGAVFGVLGAFAMLFPERVIVLLIPPIPLPARVFVFLYAIIELILGVTSTQSGVAHFAHIGGLIGGIIIVRRWRRRRSSF